MGSVPVVISQARTSVDWGGIFSPIEVEPPIGPDFREKPHCVATRAGRWDRVRSPRCNAAESAIVPLPLRHPAVPQRPAMSPEARGPLRRSVRREAAAWQCRKATASTGFLPSQAAPILPEPWSAPLTNGSSTPKGEIPASKTSKSSRPTHRLNIDECGILFMPAGDSIEES